MWGYHGMGGMWHTGRECHGKAPGMFGLPFCISCGRKEGEGEVSQLLRRPRHSSQSCPVLQVRVQHPLPVCCNVEEEREEQGRAPCALQGGKKRVRKGQGDLLAPSRPPRRLSPPSAL